MWWSTLISGIYFRGLAKKQLVIIIIFYLKTVSKLNFQEIYSHHISLVLNLNYPGTTLTLGKGILKTLLKAPTGVFV